MSINVATPADAIDVRRSKIAERLLVPASFITTSGNAFQITAASVLVYHADANAVAVGWVFIALSLPGAVLAWLFGKLVDKADRRTLSVIADVASAVIAFSLPVWLWSGGSHSIGSYVTTFLLACSAALFMPASNALVKERVREDRLGGFNAHFELASNAGMLAGSGLAGILYAAFGPVPLFVFNSGTFVCSAVLTYLIGRRRPASPAADADESRATIAAPAAAQARVSRVALLYVNASLGLIVASPLLLVLVLHNFHKGPWLIGVSDALAFAGFLVGATLYPKVSNKVPLLPLAVIAMLANVVLWCLEPVNYILLMCLIPFGGIVYALTRIAARTLLTKASPHERVGRIFGGTQAVGLSLAVLFTVLLSWLADATRVQYAFWALGAVQALLSIGAYLSLRKPGPAPASQPTEVAEPSIA
jgi:MFS family permease